MKFGSKGVADLIGIGEALRHIHAIIKDLLETRRDWQADRTKKLAEANIAVAEAEQARARADQADAEAQAEASKAAASGI